VTICVVFQQTVLYKFLNFFLGPIFFSRKFPLIFKFYFIGHKVFLRKFTKCPIFSWKLDGHPTYMCMNLHYKFLLIYEHLRNLFSFMVNVMCLSNIITIYLRIEQQHKKIHQDFNKIRNFISQQTIKKRKEKKFIAINCSSLFHFTEHIQLRFAINFASFFTKKTSSSQPFRCFFRDWIVPSD